MSNPRKKTLKSGKVSWEARYYDAGGTQRSRSFPTEREAKDFLAEHRMSLRRGEWTTSDDDKTTVLDLVEEWVASAKTEGTRGDREALAKNLGTLAHLPIRGVRPKDLNEWISHLTEGRPWAGGKPLGPLTADLKRSQLSGLFTRAMKDGRVARTPFTSTVRALGGDEDEDEFEVQPERLLTLEQINRLSRLAADGSVWTDDAGTTRRTQRTPALAAMIELGAGSGLRGGEVAGLVLRDVDLKAGEVHVRRQAKRSPTGWRKLKTKKSRRVVPIAQPTVEAIERYLELSPQKNPEGPLFRTTRKGMWTAPTLGQALAKLRPAAGLPAVVFHDFRHFYATALIGRGLSVKAVSELLGHSTPATTLRVYAHFWPEERDQARVAIAGALGMWDSHGIADLDARRAVAGESA